MKDVQVLAAVALLGAATLASGAHAQDICNSVIVPTRIDESITYEQELAFLKTIQSEESLERARSAGLNFSNVNMSLSGSYGDFDKRRNAYLEEVDFDLSVSESIKIAVSFLPNNVTDAWVDCIKRNSNGVIVYAEDITKDGVTAVVFWNPPPGVLDATQNSEVRGASIDDQQLTERLGAKWTTEESRSTILDREAGAALRVVVNIGKYRDNLLVPAYREAPPLPPAETMVFVACDPAPFSYASYVNLTCGAPYGQVLRNATNDPRENVVEYSIDVKRPGEYLLSVRFANVELRRSVQISVNGEPYFTNALGQTNGTCFSDTCVPETYVDLGRVYLDAGENRLRVENHNVNGSWIPFPHLYDFKLTPM